MDAMIIIIIEEPYTILQNESNTFMMVKKNVECVWSVTHKICIARDAHTW